MLPWWVMLAEHFAPNPRRLRGDLMSDQGTFALDFETGQHNVRKALALLQAFLHPLGLTDDALGVVEIVLAEALNNVTEHAYGPDGHGPVELRAEVLGTDGLRVTIRDCGATLPAGLLRSPKANGVDPASLPEGGFGWHLIRTLTQDLAHARLNGWNALSFTIVFAS